MQKKKLEDLPLIYYLFRIYVFGTQLNCLAAKFKFELGHCICLSYCIAIANKKSCKIQHIELLSIVDFSSNFCVQKNVTLEYKQTKRKREKEQERKRKYVIK